MSEEEVTKDKPKYIIGIIGNPSRTRITLREYLLRSINDPELRIEVENSTEEKVKAKILKLGDTIKKK